MKIKRLVVIVLILFIGFACKKEDSNPPNVSLNQGNEYTQENQVVSIGQEIKFHVIATSDEPITNIVISYYIDNEQVIKLDSGLYANDIDFSRTFYQDTKSNAIWEIMVMNKERQTASTSLNITGDPNSVYGAISEYNNVVIGMQDNTTDNLWINASTGVGYPKDSGSIMQEDIDFLCYFKYSIDNNVNRPSPTFSSPGEDENGIGELYDEFYPVLTTWQTRNYTAWDIRANNGVNISEYSNCHDDSLLIHSYDDTWGKKKYKWLEAGQFIPFRTSEGKHGIVEIVTADTTSQGKIVFNMKIQK